MSWVTGAAVYVILWWLVLFMALPWGVRTATREENPFGDGPPANPRIGIKVLVTTVVAGLLWGVYYVVVTYHLVTLVAD